MPEIYRRPGMRDGRRDKQGGTERCERPKKKHGQTNATVFYEPISFWVSKYNEETERLRRRQTTNLMDMYVPV